jgi:hypothetical protein
MQNGSELPYTYLVSEREQSCTYRERSFNGRGFQLSREKPHLRRGWQDDQAWEVVAAAATTMEEGRKESEEPS